jgi:hypothetical protein
MAGGPLAGPPTHTAIHIAMDEREQWAGVSRSGDLASAEAVVETYPRARSRLTSAREQPRIRGAVAGLMPARDLCVLTAAADPVEPGSARRSAGAYSAAGGSPPVWTKVLLTIFQLPSISASAK